MILYEGQKQRELGRASCWKSSSTLERQSGLLYCDQTASTRPTERKTASSPRNALIREKEHFGKTLFTCKYCGQWPDGMSCFIRKVQHFFWDTYTDTQSLKGHDHKDKMRTTVDLAKPNINLLLLWLFLYSLCLNSLSEAAGNITCSTLLL